VTRQHARCNNENKILAGILIIENYWEKLIAIPD
jgi:hypothetical protein